MLLSHLAGTEGDAGGRRLVCDQRGGYAGPRRSCSPDPRPDSHASGGSATLRGRRAHPREFAKRPTIADIARQAVFGQGRVPVVRAQTASRACPTRPGRGAGHRPQDSACRPTAPPARLSAAGRPFGSWSTGRPPRSAWNRLHAANLRIRPNCRPTTSPCVHHRAGPGCRDRAVRSWWATAAVDGVSGSTCGVNRTADHRAGGNMGCPRWWTGRRRLAARGLHDGAWVTDGLTHDQGGQPSPAGRPPPARTP